MSARYEVRVDVSGIVDTQTQGDDWDRYRFAGLHAKGEKEDE